MMGNKIRLAITANGLSRNGITAVIANYVTHLRRELFDITICNSGKADDAIVDYFRVHGIIVESLPRKEEAPVAYLGGLISLLKRIKPDIVHVNGSSALMAPELLAASLTARVRIAHCHGSNSDHPLVHNTLLPIVNKMATNALACSDVAGDYLFKFRSYDVLPNAFEIDQYFFNEKSRYETRKELDIPSDAHVICVIGRINSIKNQRYAIKLFERYCSIDNNSYLLVVGDGPDYNDIARQVQQSPYAKHIMLVGNRENTAPYYNASDLCMSPTRHEGLGITILEAQVNGMPCIISDVVPEQAYIGGKVARLSLASSEQQWVDAMVDNMPSCCTAASRVPAAGCRRYDINLCCQYLESYYRELVEAEKTKISDIHLVVAQ